MTLPIIDFQLLTLSQEPMVLKMSQLRILKCGSPGRKCSEIWKVYGFMGMQFLDCVLGNLRKP
jgi:hypothetical protein